MPLIVLWFESGLMQVQLTVIAGPHVGTKFTFTRHDHFLVGRSPEAHFRLPKKDPYFSRLHFLIEVNPPLCRLIDLASTNGTEVNQQRVEEAVLADGDIISGGETLLRVRISEAELTEPERPETSDNAAPHNAISAFQPTIIDPEPEAPAVSKTATSLWRLAHTSNPAPEALSGVLPDDSNARIASRAQPFPDYGILDEIGRGSMGVVYRAIRRRDGVLVALKTIQPAMQSDALELQRFLREAQILRQLQHPHIVGCEAVGEVDGVLFFEMEYVPGLSAFEMIEHCPQPIPFAPCVSLVCQLLAALQTAHQQQFVHRDIKPGNLLIVERDGQDYLKLADFGLARVYQASKLSGLTLDGAFGGTMGFIAPEQITQFRQCLPTSDQYSAAATLYYLLAKAFVYDLWGNLGQQVQQILSTPIVPLTNRRSDLPEGLVRVIHRGLARDPSERYLNAAEFRAALVPFTMGAAQ